MHNHQALKILFIINPVSGGKVKTDWEVSIRDFFKKEDHQIDFYLLTGKNDLPSIKHHIDRINPDQVVAVGGDGTVKMVAGLLKETTMAKGILPAGSANGMAKELGIPLDPVQALEILI